MCLSESERPKRKVASCRELGLIGLTLRNLALPDLEWSLLTECPLYPRNWARCFHILCKVRVINPILHRKRLRLQNSHQLASKSQAVSGRAGPKCCSPDSKSGKLPSSVTSSISAFAGSTTQTPLLPSTLTPLLSVPRTGHSLFLAHLLSPPLPMDGCEHTSPMWTPNSPTCSLTFKEAQAWRLSPLWRRLKL